MEQQPKRPRERATSECPREKSRDTKRSPRDSTPGTTTESWWEPLGEFVIVIIGAIFDILGDD